MLGFGHSLFVHSFGYEYVRITANNLNIFDKFQLPTYMYNGKNFAYSTTCCIRAFNKGKVSIPQHLIILKLSNNRPINFTDRKT